MDSNTYPPTALRLWVDETGKGRTVEKLAAKIRKRVGHASVKYVESIVDGYYPPSRKLAHALAGETGVPFAEIMSYEYRAPRAA